MKRSFAFVLLLALLLAACSHASAPSATPASLTVTQPASASHLTVLFQDDFSNPKSGWDTMREDDAVIEYTNGHYRIWLNYPHTNIWANPGLKFTDTRTEVDATKVGGPDNNAFGIICRYQDADHFYFFLISSDGYYGIGKTNGERQTLLTNDGNMKYTTAIHKGHATNHLRADCVGTTLALYVNGQRLALVEDAEFGEGDVGLIVGTFDQPGADIVFDNFAVYQP